MSDQTNQMMPAVQSTVGRDIGISHSAGGLTFTNMNEVVEFARLMARGGIAVPKFLRDNPGACLAVTLQAVEWRMSPFAVANKAYSVNDRLAYESQLVQAVILQRAPIKGRLRFDYEGEGPTRRCVATATLQDGQEVFYRSPELREIKVKNSPLWVADPDQQLSYFSGRSLARRYFPDVLLGVYSEDELRDLPEERSRVINPLHDDIEGEAIELRPVETTDPVTATAPAEPSGPDVREDEDGLQPPSSSDLPPDEPSFSPLPPDIVRPRSRRPRT